MSKEDQDIVEIDKETFSIVKVPASETRVVQSEKERLLGSVNLPALVEDLGTVGNFVRIAYNGVSGYIELQITVRELGVNITKLCDKSAVTVAKFKQASGSILDDLQGTYQFLLDGYEDIAIETLRAVSEVAKDMASAADQLHRDFDDESKRAEEVLKETMRTKGSETERKEAIDVEKKKLEMDKIKASAEKQSAEEDFKLYEKKYEDAEAKQEAHEASASNPLKAIANAVLSPLTLGRKVFNTDEDLRRAQEAREEKLKFLEEMKNQRQTRSKALQDIAEFTKKIENCQDDKELAEVAIGALHGAMGGLQKLSAVMMKAALFWKQMQIHCEQLAKEKMQRIVTAGMKREPEERLELWTNKAFKTQAIKYYAQWVALDDVCGTYMGQIQETQTDLYRYLTENPTLEEARKNVRDLASRFGKELEKAQKAIMVEDSAYEEEMKKLQASVSDA